ncbi:MAG: hypothetical protein A3F10_07595 [Coxiella sp. RIFCSPHIGHO2_12_FULL_42_15]|nr:MAG: hypothetical protein A3F10_07595 [Coxiella sp. RIFCSPHIGHO2_12_FULL_42_15]
MESQATTLVKRLHASRYAIFLPWIVCSLAAFFYFYELCLRVALGTMIPEVQSTLNISVGQIGIISAFYYYAYTPMQIAAGAVIDRVGPRKLLISMVLLCALGSVAFAMANDFILAAAAQFFIGFASAFAFIGVLKLASNWLPIKYFSLISGLTTSLGMIGAMLSNIIIAFLLRDMSWREVWYIFAAFGVMLMVVFYFFCVNRPAITKKVKNTTLQWGEIKADCVLMIKSPFFWVNAIIGGLLYFPTTSFASLWGIPYIMAVYGIDKIEASTIVSMIFFGWAVGGPMAGWLSANYIKKRTLLINGSLLALLLICLALLPIHFSPTMLSVILFLFGVASSVEVLVFEVAAKLFDGRSAGTVASLTNFILMLVCTVLQPVIGLFIDHNSSVSEFRFAMLIIPIGLFIAFLMSFFAYNEKNAE